LIKEIYINPEKLQTLGKTLEELDNVADRISKHERIITWKERFMHYLHITGYIALGSSPVCIPLKQNRTIFEHHWSIQTAYWKLLQSI